MTMRFCAMTMGLSIREGASAVPHAPRGRGCPRGEIIFLALTCFPSYFLMLLFTTLLITSFDSCAASRSGRT